MEKVEKKKKKIRGSLYSIFLLGWRGKFVSLLVALLIYAYYQSVIHEEASFTLPLKTDSTKNVLVQFLDKREAVLHLSGRSDDLETLRSSDFEVYVQVKPEQNTPQELPVQYRLRNNNLQIPRALKIKIEPSSVRVLVEQRASKELPVKVSLDGYPETGYSLGTYRVYPQNISVTGPESVLEKLDAIGTQTIDITGRNSSFQEVARLQFISELSGEERGNLEMSVKQVQVDIQINARTETQTLTIQPQLVGLPDTLELLNIIPKNVQLILQGNSELIEQLFRGEQELQIELDGGDIFASGRYSLPVLIDSLPEGVNLLSSIPSRVSVVVGNR